MAKRVRKLEIFASDEETRSGYEFSVTEKWYWRLLAPNGKKVAASGEAFTRWQDARTSVLRILEKPYRLIVSDRDGKVLHTELVF